MSKRSNKNPKTISGQLRQHLKDCGKSTYQLERETGIHNTIFSRFLRGERGLSLEVIDDVCEYFSLRLTRARKRTP